MRTAAADRAGISLHRPEFQSAAAKYLRIGVIHLFIANFQTGRIAVERIEILHDEFATTHQAKPRPNLITILVLNLINEQRQLPVRTHILFYQRRHHFLMRGSQAKIPLMPVFQPEHFIAVYIPAAGLLPDLRRLDDRHRDFLTAFGIHLFPHNLFYLAQSAPGQRQIGIHAACRLADHAGPQHQLVTWHFRFSRNFP